MHGCLHVNMGKFNTSLKPTFKTIFPQQTCKPLLPTMFQTNDKRPCALNPGKRGTFHIHTICFEKKRITSQKKQIVGFPQEFLVLRKK